MLAPILLALAVSHYAGALPPAPRDEPAERVAAAFVAALRGSPLPAPARDPRLDAFARALAELGAGDGIPPPRTIDHLMRAVGMVEDHMPHLTARATQPDKVDVSADELARLAAHATADALSGGRRRARLGVGSARVDGRVHVVVATIEHLVELAPLPRQLPARGSAAVEARLAPGLDAPVLFVAPPDGPVRSRRLGRSGERWGTTFTCDAGPGRYRVEIGASGPLGPEVIANFPVWCGVAPPVAPPPATLAERVFLTEEDAEAALVEAINGSRRRAGLAALRVDPRLTALARAHSSEMLAEGYMGHRSPRHGEAADRLRRAGLPRARVLAENVGRALSVDAAHEGFLDSPGHRQNLLLPDVTLVGVGIRFVESHGQRDLLVTELFARF